MNTFKLIPKQQAINSLRSQKKTKLKIWNLKRVHDKNMLLKHIDQKLKQGSVSIIELENH